MRSTVVEAVEHRPSLERNMADGKVLAHERLDRLDAVEPHQGLEFDLAPEVAPHQVDVSEAGDAPRLDARDHFAANDALIGVRILRRRPPAPQPANHPYGFLDRSRTI